MSTAVYIIKYSFPPLGLVWRVFQENHLVDEVLHGVRVAAGTATLPFLLAVTWADRLPDGLHNERARIFGRKNDGY